MTPFDYVCVIKPVESVIPAQVCLFVLDCAEFTMVKLNPLTTPVCVHDHSGKLSLKNSICTLARTHTHTDTRQSKTLENLIPLMQRP